MLAMSHRWLGRLLKLREGESVRALLMFSYLLIIIACYITTKSVRDSLFLKGIGPEHLPYVYILIAVVVGGVSTIYTRVSSRASIRDLITATSLTAISHLFLFWWLLRFDWLWIFYALYIWVSIFGVITASQFWLLANYVFNPREAKRVFAVLGAGGILGGILGGYLTQFGARWFGTEGLLLCCMAFIGITLLILQRIAKEVEGVSERNLARIHPTEIETERRGTQRVIETLLSSRHLTMLTAILAITVLVEAFVDFELKLLSDKAFSSQDELTAFFGSLFAYLGIFSLFFQLFFTSRILQRFGVGISILFLPMALLAGSAILVLVPSLLAVSFLKISDGSFRYSIHRSSMELLFLPVPMKLKSRVKSFIDMVVDRTGRGVAGLMLLLLTSVWSLSVQQLSLVVCGFLALWLCLAVGIKREYLNSFRTALEKKTIDPDLLSISISDSASLEAVLKVLNSTDTRQVAYALELLKDSGNLSVLTHLPPLLGSPSARVRALALELLASEPDPALETRVQDLVSDPDLSVRTEAIHFLCQGAEPLAPGRIRSYLHSQDYAVVGAAIQYLAKHQGTAESLIDQKFVSDLMAVEGTHRQAARASAASALGLLTSSSPLQRYLTELLQDPSIEVVRNAIQSAGRVRSRDALPLLIHRLADRHLRSDARKALVLYGSKITGTLFDYLNDHAEPMAVRANIPKLLSEMGSQEAADALMRSVDQADQFLGYRVIKALNRTRVHNPGIYFSASAIDSLVVDEIKEYYRLGLIVRSDGLKGQTEHEAFGLLQQALHERMDQKLERVFRLLGLRYSPKDMVSAYNGIRSNKTLVRANAIEFLDNLLLPDLKQLLLPLLEEVGAEVFMQKANQLVGLHLKSRAMGLEDLIGGRDPWLKTIAIYLAGRLGMSELAQTVKACIDAEDPFVEQTALWSLRQLGQPQAAGLKD